MTPYRLVVESRADLDIAAAFEWYEREQAGLGQEFFIEGEVDLSHLAGKGVFAVWDKEGVFAEVTLGPHGAIEWPGDVDLCPDALYLRLTGKQPEEVFAGPDCPDA